MDPGLEGECETRAGGGGVINPGLVLTLTETGEQGICTEALL